MKTAFIIALLCVSAFGNNSFLGSYDKLKNTLNGIDRTEFGKNLLDTIALQMTSQAPMQDIAALIRDMMADLRSQQNDADEAHSNKMGECDNQLNAFQARIDHATNEIAEATMAIKTLRARKRVLIKDIATGEQTLVMLDEQETAARAKRAQDSIDFFARQEQTKLVLDALEVIVPKLKAITPHSAAETFMELAKLGASNPIAALVEVASSLDGDALNRCITLLEDLQVDFTEFLGDDVENEIQATVDFDRLMAEIAALRKATKEKLAADKAELVEVEAALVNQKRRLAENSQELETATAGKAAKTEECDLYDAAYIRDTSQRQGELGILDQVAAIVASRLSGLNDFMQLRG